MYICMYAWKMKGMSMSFMFVMRTYVRIWAYMGVWSVCMYVYILHTFIIMYVFVYTYTYMYLHVCYVCICTYMSVMYVFVHT